MTLLLLLGVGLGAVVMARRRQRRRHATLVDRLLPDAIDVVAAGLRAGYSPVETLFITARHVDPLLRPAFEIAVHDLREGGRFVDALAILERRLGRPVRPLIEALDAGHRLGVPLDAVVERLSNDARAFRQRLLDRSARELTIELSLPLVVCVLPSFLVLVIVPTLVGTLSRLDISL
jgi:Flp pilus assembly protein TadB